MERYFYHGLGDWFIDEVLDRVIDILKSGAIKTRDEVHDWNDEQYRHICLYRKNDDYEYNEDSIISSARGGWIDHCPFFIISPDINAEKVTLGNTTEVIDGKEYTNIPDEWRTRENIPFDKIVGIALPFDGLKEERNRWPDSVSDDFNDKLKWIIDFANEKGWMIENSDEKGLCDRLDQELNEKKLMDRNII